MWTTIMLAILSLSPAQAKEEPCKSCWNETCAELGGLGLPACKKPKTKVKSAPRSCEAGKVQNADTQGHCCWPGQLWQPSKGRCVGEPECPTGTRAEGTECVVAVACPANTTWNGSACAATVSCPSGSRWNGTACEAQVACPANTTWNGTACAPVAPVVAAAPTGLQPTQTEPKTGLVWVSMPAGSFHYGCEPQDTGCGSDEKPGREATVGAFWMMQTEVTVDAYRRCMNAGACSAPDSGGLGAASEPVTEIDAGQAGTFCEWVGGRLPTAVEWEYAAKSGSSRIYPWGDSSPTGTKANCDSCGDRFERLAPVGSFPAGDTPWGLKDMAGNVREWTDSMYSSLSREVRGGSWGSSPGFLRAGGSVGDVPGRRFDFNGFRCAQ